MKDFLSFLLTSLVDHPGGLEITESEVGPSSFHYVITAQPEDVGKIIGKEGKIISAIRNLAKVVAIKENKQIRIEIGEPQVV